MSSAAPWYCGPFLDSLLIAIIFITLQPNQGLCEIIKRFELQRTMLDQTYLLQSYNQNQSLFSNIPPTHFHLAKAHEPYPHYTSQQNARGEHQPSMDEQMEAWRELVSRHKRETQHKIEALDKLLTWLHQHHRSIASRIEVYEELIGQQEAIIRQQNRILNQYSSQWETFTTIMQIASNYGLPTTSGFPAAVRDAISSIKQQIPLAVSQKLHCKGLERTIDQSLSGHTRKAMPYAKSVPVLTQFSVSEPWVQSPQRGKDMRERESKDTKQINLVQSAGGQSETYRKLVAIRISQLQRQTAMLENEVQSTNIRNMVLRNQNKQLKEIVEGLIAEVQKMTTHPQQHYRTS